MQPKCMENRTGTWTPICKLKKMKNHGDTWTWACDNSKQNPMSMMIFQINKSTMQLEFIKKCTSTCTPKCNYKI